MTLSSRDHAVLEAVRSLRQVSTNQIVRLYFSEPHTSPKSRGIRARRALARLVRWGYRNRIERAFGGAVGGSEGYVYIPANSRARSIDRHTMDVTELYVRLVEAENEGRCKILEFTPEDVHGHIRPDAYIWLETPSGRADYFVEYDRSAEYKPQLTTKIRAYQRAFNSSAGNFAKVVWVVSFAPMNRIQERKTLIHGICQKQEVPELFSTVSMEDFVNLLVDKS